MHETEIKILEIDKEDIAKKLEALGAEKVLDTRLRVQWIQDPRLPSGNDAPWYMRVRSDSDGNAEVTWKGRALERGEKFRKTEELGITVNDMDATSKLFEILGFELYAYQEKDRVSYTLKDWRFEIDTYPSVPTYMEIEGKDEAHLHEAIELLGLENNKTANRGERILIEEEYGTDWYDMRF